MKPVEKAQSSTPNPSPVLRLGRSYHTWEELEELVEAYGLTDENSSGCFQSSQNFSLHAPIGWISSRDCRFAPPWTLVKMPDIDGLSSQPTSEPLKHYVWVEGRPLPSKAHNAQQEAVAEGLRLSQKEGKRAFIVSAVIEPVIRAEIVDL